MNLDYTEYGAILLNSIPLFKLTQNYTSRREKNYNLVNWKKELNKFTCNSKNKALNSYIKEILDLSYDTLKDQYYDNNRTLISVSSRSLPQGFFTLNNLKNVSGIYQFVRSSGESYVGMSTNLWRRLFVTHKNRPGTGSMKHNLFYALVRRLGWSKFHLNILCVLPDHLTVYKNNNRSQILTDEELKIIALLRKYHLTLLEQFFLDTLEPTLNTERLANASSKNKGRTGVKRDTNFRDNASKIFIGREFDKTTKDLHRKNQTGKVFSEETRRKMSQSHGGVRVYVKDMETTIVKVFNTKSAASEYLGISIRTLTRWRRSPQQSHTIHNTGKTVCVSFNPYE